MLDTTTDETGQTSVEYALVLAFVAMLLALALIGLNVPFSSFVTTLANTIAGLG